MATKRRLGAKWAGVSLSHGTMIAEDVIESLHPPLPDRFVKKAQTMALVRDMAARKGNQTLSATYAERLDAYLNEDIWDYLNGVAPKGYYFGAHPGDGSDYGFWKVEEEDAAD